MAVAVVEEEEEELLAVSPLRAKCPPEGASLGRRPSGSHAAPPSGSERASVERVSAADGILDDDDDDDEG